MEKLELTGLLKWIKQAGQVAEQSGPSTMIGRKRLPSGACEDVIVDVPGRTEDLERTG